jgi:CMP-N-acetylneuraminic acid synthetase
MKILGIIPARGGSKGIPHKNIKPLKGKPLIVYTIEAALQSKLDEIIVSTECHEIAEISREFNVKVLMRPENLARDDTPTLPVLQDVVERTQGKYDAVMVLQPTSPFRTACHINDAIDLFSFDKNADSLVSVVPVPHNFTPSKLMILEGNYLKGNTTIIRRQESEKFFARNGAAIYITKIEVLKTSMFGEHILPFFMKKIDGIDIDDIEDWEIAEKILS